ncbi:hyperosmotically inducible protein [Thermodesulfitimonas autotrophica]|uniref:Hyperosmotically inducible protein n=1 Tax=Thermodesulfitimonas autotrophica TaxID=1894989 RepID=A0A3N5AEP8_9THEO|nr:BON domain-containing protein [Thermodesulfitimonas autotrophica]RPF42460.1 hyperosmotically inducible protein [Thermodesulfitimonas autotrophica]
MDQTELKAAVEALLARDKNLRGYGIRVNVDRNTVYLTGVVDTLSEKEYLAALVSALPGVDRVVPDIAISTDGAINDGAVLAEVAEELQVAGVDPKHIGARVKDGVVTLIGRTDDPAELAAAREAAAKARGVKGVTAAVRLQRGNRETLAAIFHRQVKNDREEGKD